MLNEILEFDCYLSGVRKDIPILNDAAKENLSGIRRPLQVLARGFLSKCADAGLPPSQGITACRVFLYTWMAGQLPETIPVALPASLRSLFRQAETNSFLQFANRVSNSDPTDNIRKKAKYALRAPYHKGQVSSKNNFNQVCFDCIIADALFAGELQNCCLSLKQGEKNSFGLSGSDKERKIALAVVSHYLQQRARIRNDPTQTFVPVVQPEIGGWVNVRPQRSGAILKDGTEAPSVAGAIANVTVSATGQPLFEKISMDNSAKVRVNPRWLEAQDVQLLPYGAAPQEGYRNLVDQDLLLKIRKG